MDLTYDAWKRAIRAGDTFVTYGPLLEFDVEGSCPGQNLLLPRSGGTVNVHWEARSVTVPMRRVDLIVNGEVRESRAVKPNAGAGDWSVRLERSSWLALLVRGHHPGRPEMIAAHSSPVMVQVKDSPFYAEADALSILEQIEGAMAYLGTFGPAEETAACRRMRMVLTGAHRRLHNRMHQLGHYHKHGPGHNHAEHGQK